MRSYVIVLFAIVVVSLALAGCISGQQQSPTPEQGTPQGTVTVPATTPVSPGTSQPTVTVPVTAGGGTPTITGFATPVPVQTYVGVPSTTVLQGTWYLQSILLQGAGAPLDVSQSRITATFDDLGQVTGNSGCNNYDGPYAVTGQLVPSGSGIKIGPLSKSSMFCPASRDTETMYMQILGSAVSYALFPGQRMSITDNQGNSLVFSKAPYYSQGSVPYY